MKVVSTFQVSASCKVVRNYDIDEPPQKKKKRDQ